MVQNRAYSFFFLGRGVVVVFGAGAGALYTQTKI